MEPRAFGRRLQQPERIIDDAAPAGLRVEWLAAVFDLVRHAGIAGLGEREVYDIVNGALGIANPAVNPYGGLEPRLRRVIDDADWQRFYDLVLRFRLEFQRNGIEANYDAPVNVLFAAHGIAWNLTADGRLERVVPAAVQALAGVAREALERPGYDAALQLYLLAKEAFDAVPRRDRDACANAFDAMESAAKIQMNMHAATFGAALDAAHQQGLVNVHIRAALRGLEVVRHNHCGHGMVVAFGLSCHEVDFMYSSCVMGANLFARLR